MAQGSTISTPTKSESQKKIKKRHREEVAEQTPSKKVKKDKIARHSDHVEAKSHRRDRKSHTKAVIEHSAFHHDRVSLYLTISPIAYSNARKGLVAEHIAPLLLTYYPPLDGVVLAFENAVLSNQPGEDSKKLRQIPLSQSIDEYGVSYMWLTVDFLLFRPAKGVHLEGVVTFQTKSMIGLLCYNYFNATIESARLPKDWIWRDGSGDSKNHSGFYENNGVQVDGRISFTVHDFEAIIDDGAGAINIYGTMLPNGI